MAACALFIGVAHLLFAQLTLALGAAFALTGRATRWQPRWLLGPAVAGLLWTLAEGPGAAIAGFARGPAHVLGYFGDGDLAARLDHPLAAFGGAGSWLPAQAPLALICAAAEAAVISWLDWLHTDEWAVKEARPEPVAALRRLLAVRTTRSGGVLTREGCVLGIVPATGALAELRWTEIADGALVVGADPNEVTVTCLQIVHAALRRRKPLIVLDGAGDAGVSAALATACRATGTPLSRAQGGGRLAGERRVAAGPRDTATVSASQLWGRGGTAAGRPQTGQPETGQPETGQPKTDRPEVGQPETDRPGDEAGGVLGPVISARRAVLLAAHSPELAARAAQELALAGAQLRRIGVPGDALVWIPDGARLPAAALAAMIREGGAVGLPVLVGTTSPEAAAAIAGLVGTLIVHRVASPELAAGLAARTGTWLLPASTLREPVSRVRAGSGVRAASGLSPPDVPMAAAASASPSGLVPCPRVPPRTLLALGPARFVLTVNAPRPRLVTGGQMVPARLPPAGRRERTRP